MGAMNLTELMNEMRHELQEETGAIYSATDLTRAVGKTEALLGRLIPKKNVVEARIMIDRSAQALVINSETGTTDYKPIKYDSESISTTEAAGGTIMVRGTDYNINYMTGVVTKYDTGSALSDGTYFITYKQDTQRLDIGTLVANPIKITRVEYPVGDIPVSYLSSYDVIEDFLILHKDDVLTQGKYIRIYYDSEWTGATTSTDGEYPSHLDDVIILGAVGQALIFKAEKYVQDAVAEILLANASADGMATALTASNAALNKVDTYLIDTAGGGVDNAKDVLANVTDDIAQLRTRIDAILSKSNDFLFSADTDPSAKYYLTQGDAYIPTVNVAERVAEKYADYARTSIQLFNGLVAEANTRIANIRTYIDESAGWTAIARGFIEEAAQRIADVQSWATQAGVYATTSREYLNIAGRYLASGQSKIDEFYSMLGFKPEIQHVRASSAQAEHY